MRWVAAAFLPAHTFATEALLWLHGKYWTSLPLGGQLSEKYLPSSSGKGKSMVKATAAMETNPRELLQCENMWQLATLRTPQMRWVREQQKETTLGTTGMKGCGILSPSVLQVSHKKKQDQIGKILSIGKLYPQDNYKAKPAESETRTYRKKKQILNRNSVPVKIYLVLVESLGSKFFFWIHFSFNVFINNEEVEWNVSSSNRNLNLSLKKKKKKKISELGKQHFSTRICFIFTVQWLKQYRNLTCKTEFISQCLSEGNTYVLFCF